MFVKQDTCTCRKDADMEFYFLTFVRQMIFELSI